MILQVLVIIWLISAITLSAATLILMEQSSYTHARDRQAQLDKSDAALGWLAANVEPAQLPLKATASDSVTWVYNGNCIKVYVDTTAKKLLEKQKTFSGAGDCSAELSDPSLVPVTLATGVDENVLPAAHPAVLTFYTGVDNTSPTLPANAATTAKSFDITLPLDGVIDPASTSAATYHIIFGGVVASSKLADNAVTSAKLGTGAVSNTKLATNGVPPAAFDANAISTRDFIPLVTGDNQNYAPQGSTGTNNWRTNASSVSAAGLTASSAAYTLIQVNYADRCVPGKQLWARGVYTIYNPSTSSSISVGIRLREYDGPNPPANLSAVTGASVYQVAPSTVPAGSGASGFYGARTSAWRMVDGGGCNANNELVNPAQSPRFYQVETSASSTNAFAVVNAGIEIRYAPAASALSAQAPYVPEHVAPADGSFVLTATPTLKARFNDPNQADTGQLNFQVCSDPACSTVITSGSSAAGIANGSSGTWAVPGGAVLDGGTYYWRVQGQDNTGLTSSFAADSPTQFKVSTTPPTLSLALAAGTSPAYQSITGTTVYFNPNAPSGGSFAVRASVSDSKWALDTLTFPALGANWTGGGTVNGPGNSPPTVNQTYSWTTGAGTKSPASVSLASTSGRSATANFDAVADSTAPTGGTISYVNGTIASGPVALSGTFASDAGSGMSSGTVERRSVAVSGASCGTGWSAWASVSSLGAGSGAWSVNDNTVAQGNCYQYRYVAADNVSNSNTFTTTATVQLGSPPINTVAPVITDVNGAPLVDGDTVTTDNGTWSGSPSSYAYAWDACGYKSVVQQDNPAGYWRLGEPAGWNVAIDESGNGNGGWYTGSPTLGAAGALSGDSNTAATFNGTSQYLTIGKSYQFNAGNFTIEGWFKVTGSPPSAYVLWEGGGDGTLTGYTQLYIASNGRVVASAESSGSGASDTSPAAYNDGLWHYVAFTRSGNTFSLYLDNQAPVTTTAALGDVDIPGMLPTIGRSEWGAAEYLQGSLDDFAVYLSALSTARINAHYQAGNAGTALCSAISGQTTSSLTVAAAHVGSKVRSNVTATGTNGSATAPSSQSSVVQAVAPANTSVPTIADVQGNVPPVVGDTLNASPGVWTGSSPSYSYQWQRCDTSAGAVMSDTPAGFWRLSEPNGTYLSASDASGNARDGIYVGAPTYGTAGPVPSSPNTAVSLNGTSQYVSLPTTAALRPTTAITAEGWVKFTTVTSNYPTIISPAPVNSGYLLFKDDDSAGYGFAFRVRVGSSLYTATSGVVPTAGQWYHVAGTFDGTTVKIYVNGVLDGSAAASGAINYTTPAGGETIGAFTGGAPSDGHINGSVADVAVYGSALPAARISAHYSTASSYCSPIPGAIGSSYSVQASDAGSRVKVSVTGANPAGNVAAISSASGRVAQTAPVVDTFPVLSGTVATGQTLTSTAGVFSGNPSPSISYAWQRCGYGAALRADSPVAWLRLGDTSGTTAIDQIGFLNGTYSGGVTLNAFGALALDGDTAISSDTTGQVAIPNASAINFERTNPFSLEAWAATANTTDSALTLFEKGTFDTNGASYGMAIRPASNVMDVWLQGSSNTNRIYKRFSLTGITLTAWHHYLLTYNGSSDVSGVHLYIDGAEDTTVTYSENTLTSSIQNTQPLTLLQGFAGGNGSIDEVAVYASALTAASALAHYNMGLTGCQAIAGQTASSYTASSADRDSSLRSVVTATNAGGSAAAASQRSVKIVPPPTNTSAPTTSGILLDNQLLTSTAGSWTGTPAFTYHWQRCLDYAAAVMSDAPAGYWRLNEATGSTAFDTAGANNGTYNTTTLGASSPLSGCESSDTAATLNGTSSYVGVPDSPSLSYTNDVFSLEAWVKTTSNNEQWIATKWGSAAYEYALRLFPVGGTVRAGFTIAASGNVNNDYVNGTTVLSDGSWHYLVGTSDGSNLRVYVDGTLEGTQPITKTMVDTTIPFEIGRRNNGDAYVNGSIDEVAVYPSALAQARITAHYNAGRSVFTDIASTNSTNYTTASSDIGNRVRVAIDASTNGGTATAYSTLPVAGESYRARVLDDQPIRYWRLGETSGTTAADLTGNENGVYVNGPALNQTSPLTGTSDGAVSFNGTNQYITTSTVMDLEQFSVDGWVKTGTNAWQTIAGSSSSSLQLMVTNTGVASLGVYDGSTWATANSTATVTDNKWHYVAGTFDGSTLKVYVDGALQGAATTTKAPAYRCPIQIGGMNCAADGYSGQYLNGSLDDIAIYDHALTATQVYKHYRASNPAVVYGHAPFSTGAPSVSGKAQVASVLTTSAGSWTGNPAPTTSVQWQRCGELAALKALAPAGYWRLGEASGTNAADSSANGLNGTYVGSPTLGQPGALAGDADTAVSFNGAGTQLVSVPSAAALTPAGSALTLEAWVKVAALSVQSTPVIWKGANTGADLTTPYALTVNPAGKIVVLITNGTSEQALVSNTSIVPGSWYQIAAAADGSTLRIFINGKQDASAAQTVASYYSNATALSIGGVGIGGAAANFLNGLVDDAAVFSSALSGGQIAALYRAGQGTGGCVNIGGATSATYTPVSADISTELRSVVTASNSAGAFSKASSWTPTILQSYAGAVSGDSPNAWYRLGETSGTSAADSSGHGYTGTYTGGVTLNVAGAISGDSNGAAHFDGSTGYVNLPVASVTQGGGSVLSFEGWMRRTVASGGALMARNDAGNYTGYQFATSSANTSLYMRSHTGTGDQPAAVTMMNDGFWHYYAGTFDGTCDRIYLDGQLANTSCFGGPVSIPAAGGTAWIARDPVFTSMFFNADIDEVASYSYTLTPNQIRAHWNAGAPSLVNDIAPSITGTPQDGQTLTAATGSWRGVLPITYSYQWRRCDTAGASCSNIPGATASSYQVVPADVGSTIRVAVTASDNPGTATAASTQTATVTAVPPANTVQPAVIGTAQNGQQLVADQGTWTGTPTLSYSYQWRRARHYSATVLQDSPSGYWRLGEASGTALNDASGNGNNGTYTGTTLAQAGALATSSDTSASFNGTSDHASVANNPTLNPKSAITLETWFKPTAGTFASQKCLLQKAFTSHSSPYYQYTLCITDTGPYPKYIDFWLALNGSPVDLGVANSGFTYGAWNHLVATYDGSTMKEYLNGSLIGSQAASGTITSYPTTFDLAHYPNIADGSSYDYGGGLDEVAVYPTALSQTRIQAHYNAGSALTWTDIPGATSPTYALTSDDVNSQILAQVTATNAAGSVSASSPATSIVSPGPSATATGNEITDAVRSASIQGDGRTTTNLVANGGFESATTGWNAFNSPSMFARDATTSKYGTSALKLVAALDNGAYTSVTTTPNTTYTVSYWVYGTSGQVAGTINSPAGSFAAYPSTVTLNGSWQRVVQTVTTPASTGTSIQLIITAGNHGAGAIPPAFWVDGVQVEAGSSATNYVETSASAATAGNDSSFGIWQPTTNLITNGGAETNANGWRTFQGTFATSSAFSKFGSQSFLGTSTGNYFGIWDATLAGVGGAGTYTFSAWVYIPSSAGGSGAPQLRIYGDTQGIVATATADMTKRDQWQRVSATAALAGDTALEFHLGQSVYGGLTGNFYFDGIQLEAGAVATPYVETNGGSASRAAPRVQVSASGFDATRGWMAFRTRMGFDSGSTPNGGLAYLFNWRATNSSTPLLAAAFTNSGVVMESRDASGTDFPQATQAVSFSRGGLVTVVAAWTPTVVEVSVNGAAFTTVPRKILPDLSSIPTIDLGTDDQGASHYLDGDILWATGGAGTPSASDISTLNALGNTDPNLQTATAPAQTSFAWSADTTSYLRTATGALTTTGVPQTDASRVASTAGDGLAPESSYGIWPAATNLVANGGFEAGTWTNQGGSQGMDTVAQVASPVKFGGRSMQLTWNNPLSPYKEIYSPTFAVAPNTTYTLSGWFYRTESAATIAPFIYASDISWYASGATLTTALGWQHFSFTWTSPASGTMTAMVVVRGQGAPGTVYVDGVQVESANLLTPYIETAGSQQSRAVSSMKTPAASSFTNPPTGTQGWFAFRYRPEFSAAAPPSTSGEMLSSWDKDGSNYIEMAYDNAAKTFWIARGAAGAANLLRSPVQSFSAGQTLTVIGAWTGTQLKLSINGGPFSAMNDTHTVAFGATPVVFGAWGLGAGWALNGEILWAGWGTGALSDTDAATIDSYGANDPMPWTFPASTEATMTWAGSSGLYVSR